MQSTLSYFLAVTLVFSLVAVQESSSACTSDAECLDKNATTPYCSSSVEECGECKVDADCATSTEGSHCFIETESGYGGDYCAGCTTDSECREEDEDTPYCSDIHECEECITDKQCQTYDKGYKNFCLTSEDGYNYCGDCETDNDCHYDDSPYCSADHECINCISDSDCDTNSNGARCKSGYCGGCKNDTDCVLMEYGHYTPYCSADGECEQCLTDAQCDSDYGPDSKCHLDNSDPYPTNYCGDDYDY